MRTAQRSYRGNKRTKKHEKQSFDRKHLTISLEEENPLRFLLILWKKSLLNTYTLFIFDKKINSFLSKIGFLQLN